MKLTPLKLMTVLLTLARGTLTPPLDKGIVVKVSEQLIRDIAKVIADKAVEEIKALRLSDSTTESGIKFDYWNLRFTELTMTSTVDLTKDPGRDKLQLDGTIRGDISAASQWRATKKTFFYNFNFDGGVTVSASGYRITARVVLGENEKGVVGFTHDPSACSVDLGGLDLNFTGSKLSWLINLFIGFFEGEIRDVLEHYICVAINEKVEEGARELERAVFERYDSVYILGHKIEINNRPTRVTGGDTCAVVTGLGQTSLEMEEREERETEPFFPTTRPPKDWKNFTTTGTTESDSKTTSQISSSSSVVYVETLPSVSQGSLMEKKRRRRRWKRSEVDWCTVLPGAGRGVSIIVTEDVISRFAEDLHRLKMIDYTATQGPGISEEYDVQWAGKNVGTMTIPTRDHEVLKNFQVTFRVTSTAAPTVAIDPDGVAVYSHLRARVTLVDTNSLEIKVEIHTTLKFTGTLSFVLSEDGVYNLVPTVVGTSDITKARFTMGGSTAMKVPAPIVQEVERQLDEMLGEMLPELIRKELRTGFPINIPDNLVIKDATIQYRDDYVLVTADNVVVSL